MAEIVSLQITDNETLEAGELYSTRWPEIRVRVAPQNTPEWLRTARAMLKKYGKRQRSANEADDLMDPKNLRAGDETFVRANWLGVTNGQSDKELKKLEVNGTTYAVDTPEGRYQLLQMAVMRDELNDALARANARLRAEGAENEDESGN